MKGKRIVTFILLVLTGFLFLISPAGAANKEPASKAPSTVRNTQNRTEPFLAQWWRNERRRKSLKLTSDQVKTLEGILKESMEARRGLVQRLITAETAWSKLMRQGNFESPDIERHIGEMAAAQSALIKNQITTRVALAKVFSSTQVTRILKADPKAFTIERRLVGRRNPRNAERNTQTKQPKKP